jgi:hypothetical protein
LTLVLLGVCALFASARSSRACAQAGEREVLIVAPAIAAQDFEVLRAALTRLGASTERAAAASFQCDPSDGTARGPLVMGARVWVFWQPAGPLQLCFEDALGRHPRTLGPFPELSASAREQLITVIESGLAAAELAAAEVAAAESAPVAAPAAVTTPTPAPPKAQAVQPHWPSWAVYLGYAGTPWSSDAFAHMVRGSVRARLPSSDLGALFELGYVPALTSERREPTLRARATGFRLGLAGEAQFGLLEQLGIVVALGVALERVSVVPLPVVTTEVQQTRSVAHWDTLFFARVGPTLEIGARLRLGVSVGAELLTVARRYGYSAGSDLEVLVLDRARATALAEIGFLL